MSLSVYLNQPGQLTERRIDAIFIREKGSLKEITREEWNRKFPGEAPITVTKESSDCVFEANITHNLGEMAGAAGIYQHLWRPEELGIKKAEQLIVPLQEGLVLLIQNRERFEAFNPPNGWGDYWGLVGFVKTYLDACVKFPDADIEASR